jgi:hypothetical protein
MIALTLASIAVFATYVAACDRIVRGGESATGGAERDPESTPQLDRAA